MFGALSMEGVHNEGKEMVVLELKSYNCSIPGPCSTRAIYSAGLAIEGDGIGY
jgi:hypothetical protein